LGRFCENQWGSGGVLNHGLLTREHVRLLVQSRRAIPRGRAGRGEHPSYDVVTGTNLYYPATAGYDLSTGLGTPYAQNIYNILLNPPV
jgi:hypothetical protein